jgi:hypothetical protein
MSNAYLLAFHYFETTKHKLWVAWYILRTCAALLRRAIRHDLSKYSRAESKHFAMTIGKLKGLEYGSDEYKAALKLLGPALDHHYANNRHHPEHWNFGFNCLSLIDTIEMLCDWRAAVRRHASGDFARSLKINKERFGYSDIDLTNFITVAREIGLL